MKLLGVILALSLVSGVQTAAAQNDMEWPTKCNVNSCTLSRSVQDIATGVRAATFLVIVNKDIDKITVGAVTPLGVALLSGIKIVFGETPILAGLEVCYPDGCRALADIAPETISLIPVAEIQYFPFSSDRPVAISIPLDGLSAALAAARKTLMDN